MTGVSPSLRHSWISRHGLRRQPKGQYELRDARELAALKTMMDTLGPADAAIAWTLIRSAVIDRDERPFVLLFDLQDKEATVATDFDGVLEALPYGRRVIVLRLDLPMARATRALARAVGG
ncbi:MAG TPA: hypothetical protein VF533_11590 [Solirubrobacteraceae bacterium]